MAVPEASAFEQVMLPHLGTVMSRLWPARQLLLRGPTKGLAS